jgi:resuscitation-promoting factor RpfB
VHNGHVFTPTSSSRAPLTLLRSAGIEIGPHDLVLDDGLEVPRSEAIPAGKSIHLQVVTAIPVLINGRPVLTAAPTVGQAVREQGLDLYAADLLDPPSETSVVPGMLISFGPAKWIHASADATARAIRASARSTGAGLADAGISMQGMDLTSPSEERVVEEGENAQVTRTTESVLVRQESIPYRTVTTTSPEAELGLEKVLQPGVAGLAVTVTRVVRQDGVVQSRQPAQQTVLMEPQERVVARGTRLAERTEVIDGERITYWRTLQMYATTYSPCNSGTADGSCSTGTASGRPAGKGVVAVDPSLYASLNGQRVYIPGYGFAVIGDIGGGYIIEQNLGISRYKWIDLGFDDNNIQDMTGWVSVYFLSPAPETIPDGLQ